MKRTKKIIGVLVISLALILLITGCNSKRTGEKVEQSNEQSKQNAKKEDVAKEKEKEKKKIIGDFKKLISEKKEPFEIVNFIDKNISKVSKKEATEMIKELEKMQGSYIGIYTDELFKDDRQATLAKISNKKEIDKKALNTVEDEKLKVLLKNILEGKYKIIAMEGAFYPVIDYENLKSYNDYLEEEMVEYIDIKSVEVENPFLIDAGLMITWDELGNRLMTVENYLQKYPEGIKKEEILRLYGDYLIVYIEGVDNTPIYNTEDNIIYEDVISSYKKLIEENKDSITAEIINKYLNILEENENKMNKDVKVKIVNLYNEAINKLEEIE